MSFTHAFQMHLLSKETLKKRTEKRKLLRECAYITLLYSCKDISSNLIKSLYFF